MKTVTFDADSVDTILYVLEMEMHALAGDVECCSCPEEIQAWTELLKEVTGIHARIAVARYSSPGVYVSLQMEAAEHSLMLDALDAQQLRG